MTDNQAEATYSVKLTAAELLLLDGRCGQKTQAMVETARLALELEQSGLTSKHRQMVAQAVAEARNNGRLTWRSESIHYCLLCGKDAGYAVYKSGYRKGQRNLDKRRSMYGVDLKCSFVIMRGHVSLGGCEDCVQKALPALRAQLASVRAELPEKLRTDSAPIYKRCDNKKCSECGWTGHEAQMADLPAVFGGHYKGECPQCHAKNLPLGRTIVETVDGFTVVEETARRSA